MKSFILYILLIVLVSSQSNSIERHEKNMKSMKEKMKNCILRNPNSSETLKKAFIENNDISSYKSVLTVKEKIGDSDKEILKECRKETFKLLREERQKEFESRTNIIRNGDILNEKKEINENLRKMEELSHKERFMQFTKKIYSCIEESPDVTENLKKLVVEKKTDDFREFLKNYFSKLTEEEKKVIRDCRRATIKRPIFKRRLTKKRNPLKKGKKVVSPKKAKKI